MEGRATIVSGTLVRQRHTTKRTNIVAVTSARDRKPERTLQRLADEERIKWQFTA
jgi:hypothetical protein